MSTFRTNDGTTLAYEDYGTGAPMVFVAGWSLNADMWEYQVAFFLDQGFRCVLLDRRGHGRSDRPSTGYDIDTRADDLAALLDHLDLRDVTLVAHSAGGGEAVRYLTRHGSDRITRIALLAPAIPFLCQTEDNPVGVPLYLLEASLAQLNTDSAKWFADRAQGYFATHLGTGVSPAAIDLEMRRCLSASPYAIRVLQRELFTTDHRADCAALKIPVLLLHGIPDQSIPIDVASRQLITLVPHAVYKEYPDAGHGLYLSHAAQVNADILEFVKG
ncbi:alpha/beta hydrolase [Nocardia sp. 2]|uniref:Alpha/beta hydrolase n=1 Tax=Nocardia acididurans TaxID=2802282 RepID=A0ABS1M061_9NOCA|nr:alpha/beta hydrolase [Nocardia acididurans]MBL1073179.1 alpha/beta hydrolase [Nocardia acididurans]